MWQVACFSIPAFLAAAWTRSLRSESCILPPRRARKSEASSWRLGCAGGRHQVGLDRLGGGTGERDVPVLLPLAEDDPQEPVLGVDVAALEVRELAGPDPRRVEGLEDRPVPKAERRRGVGGLDELPRLLAGQDTAREPLLPPRVLQHPRGVGEEVARTEEEAEEAPSPRRCGERGSRSSRAHRPPSEAP